MSLLAFASDEVDVFQIIDEMKSRDWYIQPALTNGPSPKNIHLSINPSNVEWVEPFLDDLRDAVEKVRTIPASAMGEMVRQGFAEMDPDELTSDMFGQLLQMAGMDGVGIPGKSAEINEILDALEPRFRERLLTEFMNELFSGPRGAE
jgi:hypothetical protein